MPDPPVVVVAGTVYPATLPTEEAARWLDCSPELLQKLRGTGELPVEPLSLGRRLRWSTVGLAEALGLPYEIRPADGCPTEAEAASAQVIDLPSSAMPEGAAS